MILGLRLPLGHAFCLSNSPLCLLLQCRNALSEPLRMSVALLEPFVVLARLFSFRIVPYMLLFEVFLNFSLVTNVCKMF